jgi:hypothetical protein
MTKRRQRSRGQALIMVTLGLIAMTGMLGLAVDLGWSFFVKKQAQAAADAAALAAAEEGMRDLGGIAAAVTCDMVVHCAPTPVTCTSLMGQTSNNLWNGCLYAQENGFTDGGMGGRQTVTIQANSSPPSPPTAPGINDIVYWVTVRTTQTVPQLFSAVLGNTEGTVSAIATAGIVASVVPGSFFGLNREGDCIATGNSRSGFDELCGVDVRIGGSGGTSSPVCPGSGNVSAALCAADGIALNSTCHGDGSQMGCSDPGAKGKGGTSNWAGTTSGIGNNGFAVWSNAAQIRSDPSIPATGAVDNPAHWTPQPVPTDNDGVFRDPFEGKSQPPLIASSPIGLCGVPQGQITGSNDPNNPRPIGPYLYYAYDNTGPGGSPRASADPLQISGHVTFDGSAPCSNAHSFGTLYTAGASQNSQFPMYMFYGGLHLTGESMHFGPGEYVMVGTKTSQGTSLYLPAGQGGGNRIVTGDTNAGSIFVTTAPAITGGQSYPGLQTQLDALYAARPELTSIAMSQGHVEIKSGQSTSLQLNGIKPDAMPSGIGSLFVDHENVLLWQDRRNSTIRFNPDGTILDRPCVDTPNACVGTVPPALRNNGVNEYSPEFIFDATVQMGFNGIIYQARGAWFSYQGSANISSSLRVVTGMIYMQGSGQLSLLPTAAPIIRYIVALIH